MSKRFLSCIALVGLLCSCSGIPKEKEVAASNVDITGFVKSYVKVVDGPYKFTNNGNEASITIQIELVKKPDSEICHKKYPEELRLNAISEHGTVFDTGTYGFVTSRTETAKIKDLLNNSSIGDKKSIAFTWDYFGQDTEIGKSIFNGATAFELIDETFNYCSEITNDDLHWDDMSSSTKQDDNVVNEDITGSSDWDTLLDSYEQYVKQYIKFAKTADNGDASAIAEYAKLATSISNLADKMDKAKGQLSTKQLKRYTDITMKMSTAAIK